jgi:DNA-directed RNA polymerase specialized sigma24 family protein
MKVHDPARAENMMIRDSGVREQRFEALYAAHYRVIAGYVLRRVAAQEADDVIAQVFTVAWRRLDHVPPPPDDRLWLFGVARHSVADQRRSERRLRHLWARLSQDIVATGSLTPGADASGEQVRAAMSALRPADREAAAVLGCSPNAFELRYRRARSAVRNAVSAIHPTRSDPPVAAHPRTEIEEGSS